MTLTRLSRTVQPRFPDLVLGACVLGFAFLAVELSLENHYRQGTQIIGFSATLVGLVLSLLAFSNAARVRTVVLVLLGLLALTGLYGLIEHRETRTEDAAKFAQRQAQTTSAQTSPAQTSPTQTAAQGAGGAEGGSGPRVFRSNIPVLSPLSLSGLAGLAMISMLARGNSGERRRSCRL
ncbi:hypothetical protein [Deinococcus altitudinis]|uniref:hypothetical protein n=1 Tax=Deinococcus altitudinis TaxID=468914 RepID=UPI0038919EEF